MLVYASLWLLLINICAFLCFGADKRRAIYRMPRLMEIDLLGLAIIGGTLGAYAGRRWYNHKTRKASFGRQLHMIAAAQLGVAGGFALMALHGA